MRKLDVLVPIYDEGEGVLRPLLDSLSVQQGVDLSEVGVIVCCDGGSTEVSEGTMARYPFHIEFHMCGHAGVSATRNEALGRSDAEYVMFCDADDMLCDVCGLYILFGEMDRGFDTLVSRFREETRTPDGKVTYVMHDMDSTFVHGKVHRRQWLLDEGLRFDPALTVHEDSYFNVLCQSLAKPDRARFCPQPFYLWRWRDASVCRHDPDYILKTYRNLIDSNDALVDELLRRGREDLARMHVANMTFDAYYTMNKPAWRDVVNASYREGVEARFSEWMGKHGGLWEGLTAQERAVASDAVRRRSVAGGMLMEALTVDQWLARVTGGDARC